MGGLLVYLAMLEVDLSQQSLLALMDIGLLLGLRLLSQTGGLRVTFLVLATFLLLRYLFWRTFNTLSYGDPFSFIASLTLYSAELYGIVMFLLTAFVNSRPIDRHRRPKVSKWPTVDVYVPTYNEPLEIVKTTLAAATALDYPPSQLHVYLLDDGGTWAKCNATDLEVARNARRRRQKMQALCRQLGVHYLTRRDNAHAKAGNLNAALPHTTGEFILVLDCDHVPTMDFLQETIPHFVDNPRLFLVQTPHFFVTPDPIEKNLGLFNQMPSENDMFYKAIQPGLDFWEASFFCGSAAILKREALLEQGGFSGQSITEDAETALSLHNRGWQSRYILKPLISGLHPETFTNFVNQRMRWAQGMVQLFLLKNPLRQKGLALWQKLAYLNCILFWFFPFARLVFLLAPLCYLLFGLKIYNANLSEISGYTLPYLAALILTGSYLFGQVRWFLISEIYESLQSIFSLRAVINAIRNPHAPQFVVTPKGERLDTDFISPLAFPFYALLLLVSLGFVAAGLRWETFPGQRPLILITVFWNLFSFLVIVAGLGALYERRQRRHQPRLPADDLPALLSVNEYNTPIRIRDISTGGAAVSGADMKIPPKAKGLLQLKHPLLKKFCRFPIETVNQYPSDRGMLTGIRFLPDSIEDYRDIVLLVHGDSRRWQKMLKTRGRDVGVLPAFGLLLGCGFKQTGEHFRTLITFIFNFHKKNDQTARFHLFSSADLNRDQSSAGKQDILGAVDDLSGANPAAQRSR
ncbi:MAG: UDP-forming cellulose synthase catalytic subunit [Methylohalobius crimeensis]